MRSLLIVLGCLATALGAAWWWHADAAREDTIEWIVHYPGLAFGGAVDTHRDLVANAPANVKVVTVVASRGDERDVRRALGAGSRHEVVRVEGQVSPWARDRYILFQRDGRPHCMLPPASQVPEGMRGDTLVPAALRAAHPELVVVTTRFAPQGGDVIVTERGVIMSVPSFVGTARRTGARIHEIVRELEALFGRNLVIVGRRGRTPLPPHVDVYIANAGGGRLLVADPRLLPLRGEREDLGELGVFSRADNLATAEALDRVAEQLDAAGFEVGRIPGLFASRPLPGQYAATVLTYANVLREGGTVFVPAYGLPAHDRAGREAWERLGFRAVSIRARASVRNGGAVRCLTNRFPGESDI